MVKEKRQPPISRGTGEAPQGRWKTATRFGAGPFPGGARLDLFISGAGNAPWPSRASAAALLGCQRAAVRRGGAASASSTPCAINTERFPGDPVPVWNPFSNRLTSTARRSVKDQLTRNKHSACSLRLEGGTAELVKVHWPVKVGLVSPACPSQEQPVSAGERCGKRAVPEVLLKSW